MNLYRTALKLCQATPPNCLAEHATSIDDYDLPEPQDTRLFQHDNRRLLDEYTEFDILPPTKRIITKTSQAGKIYSFDSLYRISKADNMEYQEQISDLVDVLEANDYSDDQIDAVINQRIRDWKYTDAARAAYARLLPAQSFGEGYWGMSEHVSDMTQLQRQIFEDCFNGSGRVQRPSMNIPTTNRLTRPEVIQAMVGGWPTLSQAEDLIDYFKILDDSVNPKVWQAMIDMAACSGPSCLQYFENLAGALVDDTVGINDRPFAQFDRPWEADPEAGDGDVEGDDELVINDLADLETVWQRLTKRQAAQLASDPVPALTEAEVEAVFDNLGFTTEDEKFILDRGFPTPVEFRYQTINHDPDVADWFDLHPAVMPLVQRAIRADTLSELGKLGIEAFKNTDLDASTGWVFWAWYNYRKAQLTRKQQLAPSNFGEKLLSWLRNMPDSKVRFAGWWLYRVQTGAEVIPEIPTEIQWKAIWDLYRQRKAAAPEQPPLPPPPEEPEYQAWAEAHYR